MCATISSSGRIPRSISTHSRVVTNDWRISMTRAIVGNRVTSVSNQRPMYDQSIVAYCDRSYEQSWHPVIDRTSTRGTRRPMVYDQSWGVTIDRTINRSIVRPIVRSIVRSIVAQNEVLNMTIDLATTGFAMAITYDLCNHP